jgi:signal transduction histidine kinase/DNA-binding NarL/FixJ family response regulator
MKISSAFHCLPGPLIRILGKALTHGDAGGQWLGDKRNATEEATALLEKRVAERTAQLQEANLALQAEVAIRQRAEEEAQRANRAKSLFLANMSHEIRTPLNAVLGYAQILARKAGLPRDVRPALTAISESSHHLLRLVEGILDLSKIEAGKMELQPIDFDLGALLRSLDAILRQPAEQKGLRLVVETLGHGPVWVHGDQGKLRQVLINLLGNAVKFTDHGAVRLRVVPDESPGLYRFEVIDHGPGLSADLHARIFETYRQSVEGAHQGGTGLGLSISQKLLEFMGSRLALKSQPDWGSNFHFQLHLPPVEGALTTEARDDERHPRLAGGQTVRALVVDALKVNRDILRQMLVEVGCRVKTASCLDQAMDHVTRQSPDIIFLDARLPGLDDIDGIALFRRTSQVPPKLVCYSAAAFNHEWQKFRAAGFDAFLPKPLGYDQIRECLSTLLPVRFDPGTADLDEPGQIPEATAQALRDAAEIGDFAEIRQRLDELGDTGQQSLTRRLRACAERFDTSGLKLALSRALVVETMELAS